MTKRDDSLDFFADLLGLDRPTSLFDTPVPAKPKKVRKWILDGIVVIHKVSECRCCGSRIDVVNPELHFKKSYIDHNGDVLKSMSTTRPIPSDLEMITSDSPITHEEVIVTNNSFCLVCQFEQEPESIRKMFLEQMKGNVSDEEIEDDTL